MASPNPTAMSLATLIKTPAERLKGAAATFRRLHQKLRSSTVWNQKTTYKGREIWLDVSDVVWALEDLEELCNKLSRDAAIIDRKSQSLSFCNVLAFSPVRRQQRLVQPPWHQTDAAGANIYSKTEGVTQPTTFHGFMNLPAELRLMIWETAAADTWHCKHVESILKTARTVPPRRRRTPGASATSATNDSTLILLAGAHPRDPAGHFFHDDAWGLWTASSESRKVMKSLHEAAPEAAPEAGPENIVRKYRPRARCYGHVDQSDLDMHGRRVFRLNRRGLQFKNLVQRLDREVRQQYLGAEHRYRWQLGFDGQDSSTMTGPNVMAEVLGELYEMPHGLPQGVYGSSILPTDLGRVCPQLRIANLLGVPREQRVAFGFAPHYGRAQIDTDTFNSL